MLENEIRKTIEFAFSSIAGCGVPELFGAVLGTIAAGFLFCGLWLIF